MPGPLHGLRVLELARILAGPWAGQVLADLGADVVKVENPAGGDPVRTTGPFLDGHSSAFVRLNRNKRSIAVDLKSPDGVAVLRRLVAEADVLVENLRPGTMTRLGLGYESLAEVNPRLIYASASGWGQDGPLAPLPGLDIMAQARAGLMSITGTPEGDPVKVGVPICDLVCGLYVALAVMAALRAREHTGQGQQIDVSLLESGVSFAIWEAGKYWATGEVGRPLGSAHQSTAPYQAIRTKDGWVTVGAVTPTTWHGFCVALGLDELLADDRYADAHDRHGLRDGLIPAIERITGDQTTAEVVALLDEAGVPCAPINDTRQVFTDPHLEQRGFFWDAAHPDLGPVRQIGSPMHLSSTPPRREAAGPLLGGHSVDVLREAGYDPAEIDRLVARSVVVAARPAGRTTTPAGATGTDSTDPD
jgi:formyl-CoA transferase